MKLYKPAAVPTLMNDEDVLKFFYELEQLRRIKHVGWYLAMVENPDSVAEHTLRAAQIGYVLAHMEGYNNPEEVAAMLVFHDMAETRIPDVHKVANRYVTRDEVAVVKEQTEQLGVAGEKILAAVQQVEERNTTAGIIAKDADLLETAVTAREYMERGHAIAQDWIDNCNKRMKTASAKRLLSKLHDSKPTDWWQGLKKIPQ